MKGFYIRYLASAIAILFYSCLPSLRRLAGKDMLLNLNLMYRQNLHPF